MAEITAVMVKELREATGLGMMECKKALAEAEGDLKKAEELLRIKGGARASKMAGRLAAEGAVSVNISADGKTGALVEVNCETDFVAKDENFAGFVKAVAETVAKADPVDLDALAATVGGDGQTIEAARQGLIMKIGENISVRRFVRMSARGRLACYLHGRRIGVLLDYEGGDENLGKDLAMHIAASKPICVSAEQVPAEVIAKEREIYAAQAKDSGKAAQIVAKMIDGRVAKYLAEVTLLGQPFVKNPDETVAKLLQAKGAKVHAFHMYIVGEGLEKKKDDFVAAVMAQAGQA
ncbi:MAG TPA: translation elongation factor Ts [Burkholderiales bacterium]|jgi:elongation factor Ts|nr:translation elongation factor Ts [Burkholderiales bacterium]